LKLRLVDEWRTSVPGLPAAVGQAPLLDPSCRLGTKEKKLIRFFWETDFKRIQSGFKADNIREETLRNLL